MNLDSLADVLSEVTDPDTVESIIEPRVNDSQRGTPPIESLAEIIADLNDPPRIVNTLSLIPALNNKSSTSADLETPLTEYYETYLKRRRNRSPATIAQYKRTIPKFLQFAERHAVTHPQEITTGVVDSFVDEIQEKYDADATVFTYTKNVRTWFRWLNNRDVVDKSLYRILDKDELGLSPKARDEAIPRPEAEAILQNLRDRRYGTPLHAVTELLWNGGPRIGGVHSSDVQDFDPKEGELRLRHRPETGTRLKNGSGDDNTAGDGERNIELKDEVVNAIQWYIDHERPDVTDEHGRSPLYSTSYGRAARSTLRRWVYEATSCRWAPSSSEKPACEGNCDPDSDICSQSYYPHAIRRGSIVNHLSGGLRPDLASERFDVSVAVIKKHYDPRTKRQRKEDRSDAVRNAWKE